MTAEPHRSSWAVWIAGPLVLLPVLYVASIGPFHLLANECAERGYGTWEQWSAAGSIYRPCYEACRIAPDSAWRTTHRYIAYWLTLGE
jgi:hypothetical protein